MLHVEHGGICHPSHIQHNDGAVDGMQTVSVCVRACVRLWADNNSVNRKQQAVAAAMFMCKPQS